MPRLTYADHPVHPVVNDFPSALVPASLVFDLLHLVTRRGAFKAAAFFSMLLALVTGGAAAATGYLDYREIPEGTEAKRVANLHGLLNAGVLATLVLQLGLRITGRVGLFPRLLNVAANGALAASGWYGTHLVYRHGIRVGEGEPRAPFEHATPDAGAPLAERLESLAARAPDADLGSRIEAAVRTHDVDTASPAAGTGLPEGGDETAAAAERATDDAITSGESPS